MTSIAFCNPFVPAEWIDAHGLEPRWLRTQGVPRASEMSGRRGVCPYAGAIIDAVVCGAPWAGAVLTTACDQMRYAAAVLDHRGDLPVFLMNLPSTWQTRTARSLYIEELKRLGRFLVRLGGKSPGDEELVEVMTRFDRGRDQVRRAADCLGARLFAEALIAVREGGEAESALGTQCSVLSTQYSVRSTRRCATRGSASLSVSRTAARLPNGVPLALVGGPVLEGDYDVLDWVERAGGRVVLNASEWGERTLPRPFEPARMRSQPFEELADAYFGIPDVFRRPNDPVYEYLGREMAARRVRGVVFRRYLSCDLWHAELARLKSWSPVPVLDLDVAQSESGAEARTVGRIEAFLETLNPGP
jgi:benzoyl-CoA reductase/2-hydroxyglutaryl-CoA dehydratase subunit BcrC/BadD/HgdB